MDVSPPADAARTATSRGFFGAAGECGLPRRGDGRFHRAFCHIAVSVDASGLVRWYRNGVAQPGGGDLRVDPVWPGLVFQEAFLGRDAGADGAGDAYLAGAFRDVQL